MKNLLTRFAPGLLFAAFAIGGGVALTTIAYAQATAPSAAPMPQHPPMPGPDGRGRGGPGMGEHPMMREMERFKTSLKLTTSQAALWDKAQDLMKPPTDMREKMKASHDRMAAMLDDPAFDPRKLAADMDAMESERHAKMTAVRDAWFAVYDSLNPVQRGQAREFLREHMARPHMGHMGGHREWMHKRDGEAPMPPR